MNDIVFVADIADDIDDLIAIEYLHTINRLKYVVFDGCNGDSLREQELLNKGIIIKDKIVDDKENIVCGGSLTKIADYLRSGNTPNILVLQGGFAGTNIVSKENELKKFKNKEYCRTYNFSLDHESTEYVLSNVSCETFLVSKNVCHSKLNTYGSLHKESFIESYGLRKGKCLHDLLATKEIVSLIDNTSLNCVYKNVDIVSKVINSHIEYGSIINSNSNLMISVGFI